MSDQAGEILSKAMGSRLAAQGTHIDPVPKDEHSKIGSAERAIDEIDRMVAASLLNSNIPKCYWDIVGEHYSLLNAVTRSCPTDHGITIYEAETGLIPDLDALPPLGCFGVLCLSKLIARISSCLPRTRLVCFWGSLLSETAPMDLFF